MCITSLERMFRVWIFSMNGQVFMSDMVKKRMELWSGVSHKPDSVRAWCRRFVKKNALATLRCVKEHPRTRLCPRKHKEVWACRCSWARKVRIGLAECSTHQKRHPDWCFYWSSSWGAWPNKVVYRYAKWVLFGCSTNFQVLFRKSKLQNQLCDPDLACEWATPRLSSCIGGCSLEVVGWPPKWMIETAKSLDKFDWTINIYFIQSDNCRMDLSYFQYYLNI